jgi:hypothetical protein
MADCYTTELLDGYWAVFFDGTRVGPFTTLEALREGMERLAKELEASK